MDISFKRGLAKGLFDTSTWEAEVDGKNTIVKRIPLGKGEANTKALKEVLDLQVAMWNNLPEDMRQGIALFTRDARYNGENGEELLYIRDYVDGKTLAEKLKSHYLGEKPEELILKIAEVVSRAHQAGIVHGDLKPENIVIRDDGSICIIDWETMRCNRELGKHVEKTIDINDAVGSPLYMAPEQFSEPPDKQSDVYALGMIYLKMLSGKTPYDGLPLVKVMEMKKNDPACSGELLPFGSNAAAVIDDALAADRTSRTQSVQEFIDEIEKLRPGEVELPPTPHAAPAAPQVPTTAEKPRKLVLLGHSGAGKTVLAIGLYASRNADFEVEPRADTRKFSDYGEKRINDNHEWPVHTSGEQSLAFQLSACGKPLADISFEDYAGETVNRKNFCAARLQDAEGVLLLINPGMMLAIDAKQQIFKLKDCIDFLSGMREPPPVALVVTAKDRLETDCLAVREKFEKEAVGELERKLAKTNIRSQTFRVTVTGKLKSQDNPELHPEGVCEPFRWIIEQLNRRQLKRKIKKYLCIAAAALLLPAALVAGRYWWETRADDVLTEEIQEAIKNSVPGQDRIEALAKIRSGHCTLGHIDESGDKNGECSERCRKKGFFFSAPQRDFALALAALDGKIDAEKNAYLFNRLQVADPDTFFKLDGEIDRWKPLSEAGAELKSSLRREFHGKEPRMLAICLEGLRNEIIDCRAPDIDKWNRWLGNFGKWSRRLKELNGKPHEDAEQIRELINKNIHVFIGRELRKHRAQAESSEAEYVDNRIPDDLENKFFPLLTEVCPKEKVDEYLRQTRETRNETEERFCTTRYGGKTPLGLDNLYRRMIRARSDLRVFRKVYLRVAGNCFSAVTKNFDGLTDTDFRTVHDNCKALCDLGGAPKNSDPELKNTPIFEWASKYCQWYNNPGTCEFELNSFTVTNLSSKNIYIRSYHFKYLDANGNEVCKEDTFRSWFKNSQFGPGKHDMKGDLKIKGRNKLEVEIELYSGKPFDKPLYSFKKIFRFDLVDYGQYYVEDGHYRIDFDLKKSDNPHTIQKWLKRHPLPKPEK